MFYADDEFKDHIMIDHDAKFNFYTGDPPEGSVGVRLVATPILKELAWRNAHDTDVEYVSEELEEEILEGLRETAEIMALNKRLDLMEKDRRFQVRLAKVDDERIKDVLINANIEKHEEDDLREAWDSCISPEYIFESYLNKHEKYMVSPTISVEIKNPFSREYRSIYLSETDHRILHETIEAQLNIKGKSIKGLLAELQRKMRKRKRGDED